jgi:holo-[acyl-carrier protein] synthase
MIYGVGTDIVKISRIEHIIAKNKAGFVTRVLTEHERDLFENRSANPSSGARFLAKRFAAKEAFSKAFGTGIGADVSFQDLMVKNDEKGKPFFVPSERLRLKLLELGIKKAHLSLSDEQENAVAFVVIEMKIGLEKSDSGLGSY